MNYIPIYIKSLTLNNIKTFAGQTELCLTQPDGTLAQWTLLLGDNGIGKSTLLQFIAWMKPNTANHRPGPQLDAEENETLKNLVHKSQKRASIGNANAVFVANQALKQVVSNTGSKCETSIKIGLNKLGLLNKVEPALQANKRGVFYKQEVTMYAYSASRQLGKLNVTTADPADMLPDFVQEKTELYDAEEILRTLHYASIGIDNKQEKARYSDFLQRVKHMMVSLLPDFEQIEDIEISPPRPLNEGDTGGVLITTKHGHKIPFNDFSLGYKSVASWTIDLAWRLFIKYNKSKNPLAEPAIVLVDEIDLHLHPLWQQRIMASLSGHFIRTQFIASAHSPLMVQAAVRSNYAVLKFERGSVHIENRPESIDGWRVDQILTSEFFGLKSARGFEYDELMSQREALLIKRRLTTAEKNHLALLDDKLLALPTSETSEEFSNREFLSQLVAKIKATQHND